MFGTGQQHVSSNDCRIMLQCLVLEAAKYNHRQHQRRKYGSPLPQRAQHEEVAETMKEEELLRLKEEDLSATPESRASQSDSTYGLTPATPGQPEDSPLQQQANRSFGSLSFGEDLQRQQVVPGEDSDEVTTTDSTSPTMHRKDSGIFADPEASWVVTGSDAIPQKQEDCDAEAGDDKEESTTTSEPVSPIVAPAPVKLPDYLTEEWQYLLEQVNHQYDTCPGQTAEDRFLRAKCKMTPLFLWNMDMGVEKDLDNDAQETLESIAERHRRRLARLEPGKLFL